MSLHHRNRPFAASVAAVLAVALWAAPTLTRAQTEKAQPAPAAAEPAVVEEDTKKAEQQTCQVCHQRRVTLTFACGSAGERRHLSHGDSPGPCPATNPAADEE